MSARKLKLLCERCDKDHAKRPRDAGVIFFEDFGGPEGSNRRRIVDVKVACLGECFERTAQLLGASVKGTKSLVWHHADELSGGRAMWHLQERLYLAWCEPGSPAQVKLFDLFLLLARLPTYRSELSPSAPLTHGAPIARVKR